MSRKMLISLIVLMAIVLSGLILVQTSMIKSASDIREEQFDQLVMNALDYVADQLELDEQRLARRSADMGEMPGMEKKNDAFSSVFPRGNSGGGAGQLSFMLSYSGGSVKYREELHVSLDTIQQTSTLKTMPSLMEQSMEQEERRKRWLSNTDWKSYKIQLEDWPIEKRIDSTRLELFLEHAIGGSEIDLEYKYAITNSTLGRESIIMGDKNYRSKNRRVYSQLLFQRDFDGPKPNYLNIYFPHRKRYLLKQTGCMLF